MCGAGSCFASRLHRKRKKGDVTSLFCYQDIAGNGFQKGSGCSMENESLDTSKEETKEVQQPAAPEESGKQEDWKSPVKSLVNDLLDIAESVIVSVFVVVLVFAFILRPVTVDGSSMNPTLYDKDRVLMVELFYHPQRGDVVIVDGTEAHLFSDPGQTQVVEKKGIGINLIKRVIAVAGDQLDIDFTSGTVTLNGVVQKEDYINMLTTRNDGAFTYPLTVPEGYIFVMGDNRNASTDSRSTLVGFVPEDAVIGHAVYRFARDETLRSTWAEQFSVID